MLLLPTGVGGVLYRPRFFNLTIAFSKALWEVTPRGDDLTFRIATLAMGVKVYTACILGVFKDKKKVTNCPDLNGVDFHFEKIARRLSLSSNNVTVVQNKAEASVKNGSSVNVPTSKTHLRHTVVPSNSNTTVSVIANKRGSNGNTATARVATSADAAKETNHTTTAARPTTASISATRPTITTPTTTTTTTTTTITTATTSTTITSTTPHTPILVDVAPPKRNIDHGEKGSLSSINSKHDGNFHQWSKATHYLKETRLFDINAFIQSYVVRERTPCVINPALLNYDRESWLGSITGTVVGGLQSLSEKYMDGNNRCGVVSCKNPDA